MSVVGSAFTLRQRVTEPVPIRYIVNPLLALQSSEEKAYDYSKPLVLRNPHLVFFAPRIIRFPHFQTDRVFSAGLGNENLFSRMGNLGPGNNHDFLGDPFID